MSLDDHTYNCITTTVISARGREGVQRALRIVNRGPDLMEKVRRDRLEKPYWR